VKVSRSYIFSLLFLAALISLAQNRSFTYYHFGTEEGLSNSNVLSIKQHPNNLMYMATQNGVYSYDGYNFNKLKTDSLRSNFIRNINFEGNDIVIINREEGVFKYDAQSKNVSELKELKFNKPGEDPVFIDELVLSGDFAYALTERNRITVLNTKTNTIYKDEKRKTGDLNVALCLFKTRGGRVLAGRSDGLYELKGEVQQKVSGLKNLAVHSVYEDEEGKLILGSTNKIFILKDDKIEKEITPKFKAKAKTFLFSFEKTIDRIVADKYGRIWFTASPDENLYLYENNTLYDVFEILNINPALVYCLTKDKNENIWLGTFNDGVYFIQNPFFYNVSFTYNAKNLLINEVIFRGNSAIMASSNGLYAYNAATFNLKTISRPDELFPEQIFNLSTNPTHLYFSKMSGDNTSYTLDEKGQRKKVSSVISKHIYVLNEKEGLVSDIYNSVSRISLSSQKVIDTILSVFDYKTRINSMLVRDNILYIGTSKGLTVVNLIDKTYKTVNEQAFKFPINHINLINNKIYLAHDAGISIYEDKKLIDRIGSMPLTAVKKVKFYNNIIWLATLDGLYACDKQFNPVVIYNKATGLLSNSVNDVDFDGSAVCIATDKGISLSDIETMSRLKPKLEPVKITHFEIDGMRDYSAGDKVKLSADQNDFTIKFLSPLFTKPNKQLFKYKYDGQAKDASDFQVILGNMAGGKHQVEIKASADNGINWSDPVFVDIEKEITFSETPWLYVSITGGGLLLIVIGSYVWVKRVKQKALKRVKEEQQINLLKHQSMNALLSPHFIFNSLTSIQNYINTNNSLMASEYLAKFSRLIRMIIEKAAQSHISLRDEITRLNYYLDLEKERFKSKFNFEIRVSEGLDIDNIMIPNMIIQPHAENSIIHGILPKNQPGKLLINFKTNTNNELVITIEDDGVGLIKAKENPKANHKSLGTSTIASILELNSKLFNKRQFVKMEDKSELNPGTNGTIITITIEL